MPGTWSRPWTSIATCWRSLESCPLFHHYAGELRLVSVAGRRLLEKMAVAESLTELESPVQSRNAPPPQLRLRTDSRTLPARPEGSLVGPHRASRRAILPSSRPVADLAGELRDNQNLLSAMVDPGNTISLSISGEQRPVVMASDDLTRILVNLARNAGDAFRRAPADRARRGRRISLPRPY
jgi:hypothetical protein